MVVSAGYCNGRGSELPVKQLGRHFAASWEKYNVKWDSVGIRICRCVFCHILGSPAQLANALIDLYLSLKVRLID